MRKFIPIISLILICVVSTVACTPSPSINYSKGIISLEGNSNWVYPGKFIVEGIGGNFSIGGFIDIHNGSLDSINFSVEVREPDTLLSNIVVLPLNCLNPDLFEVVVDSNKTTRVPITLNITDKLSKGTYEALISVVAREQKYSIREELCSRWLVSIK